MPLFVNGVERLNIPDDNIEAFISACATLQEANQVLKSLPVVEVGPAHLLYVNQREFAVAAPGSGKVKILGSDDATTCHLVIFRHTGNGVTCLGHLDGSSTENGLKQMLEKTKQVSIGGPEGRLEVHVVGGFNDKKLQSAKLSKEIFGILNEFPDELHLMTACVTGINNVVEGRVPISSYLGRVPYPVIYGIAVNVENGSIYPASFPDKGPDHSIRSAANLSTNATMVDIFSNDQLRIGPFTWQFHFPPYYNMYINASDDFLRTNLSTSPQQEPAYFEQHIREALCILRDNPDPEKSLFPNGKPRCYRMDDDGLWKFTSSN